MNRNTWNMQGGTDVVTGTLTLMDGSMIVFEKPSMTEAIAFAQQWHGQTKHILLVTVEEEQHERMDQREGQAS
jgi:acetylornithine/succinyldiaminopimelate/putrescine aminotransferase